MTSVYLAAAIYILSGGFSWFFVKMHSGFNVPVEFSIFYRQIFAATLFIFISILTRRNLKLTFHQFKLCIVVGVFYYCLYMLGSYYGSMYLVSGIVSFISSMRIIFAEIFLSIYHKKRPSTRIVISAALGSLGIFLMSKGNMKIANIDYKTIALGLSLAFIAPISNAASNVLLEISKRKKDIDNFVMIAYSSIIGSVFVLAAGLIRNKTFYFFPINKQYIVGLIYLSFVSSGIATLCTYHLIHKIGSLKATYMSLSHAPLAMLLAIIFQGYKIDYYTFFGMLLCLISLYIGIRYQARKSLYERRRDKAKRRRAFRKFKTSILNFS
jgi:drug/metabolite transporter (DMT)-like permease